MIAAFIGKENLTALKFLNTSYWFQKENFYYSIGAIFYIAMIIGFMEALYPRPLLRQS